MRDQADIGDLRSKVGWRSSSARILEWDEFVKCYGDGDELPWSMATKNDAEDAGVGTSGSNSWFCHADDRTLWGPMIWRFTWPPLWLLYISLWARLWVRAFVQAQTMSPLRHTIGFQGAHTCRALGLWLTGCFYAECQRFRVKKLSICRPNPGWQAWRSRHAPRWVQEWCWRWTFWLISSSKSHPLGESEHNRGMFCIIRRRVSAHRFHVVFPRTTYAPWWEWCQSTSPRALIVLESLLLLDILSHTRRY